MIQYLLHSPQEIFRKLDRPHDDEFQSGVCEAVRDALRALPKGDWDWLTRHWQKLPPHTVHNLTWCLDPEYHPLQAETILVDILRNGEGEAVTAAADKLVFDSLYVPDDETRQRLQALIASEDGEPGAREYRRQLFRNLLEKRPVERIAEAHAYSIRNREALAQCENAACYHCRKTFGTQAVTEFVENGETALCPYCGIDAVLPETAGYPLDYLTLRALHLYWFGPAS